VAPRRFHIAENSGTEHSIGEQAFSTNWLSGLEPRGFVRSGTGGWFAPPALPYMEAVTSTREGSAEQRTTGT